MTRGSVVAIYIAATGGAVMTPVDSATVVELRGIEGDRYADRSGTYSDDPKPGRHVTLIEQEALDAAARDYGVVLEPGGSRRNVVTSGVPLNHLVGREFTVGGVRLRGVRLCEPCGHLQEVTGQPVVKALQHRAGLRADVVSGGLLRVGDPVLEV